MIVVATMASAKTGAYNITCKQTASSATISAITFKVGDAEVTAADKDETVTVVLTTKDVKYVVKEVTVTPYTSWDAAKTRGSIKIQQAFKATKADADNTFTFKMPEADVDVTAVVEMMIDIEAEKDATKEDAGAKIKIEVDESKAWEENGVKHVPTKVTDITLPAGGTDKTAITVTVGSTIVGGVVYELTEIAAGSLTTGDGNVEVTKLIITETTQPIRIEQGAIEKLTEVVTPLKMLDDYALMASLKDNFEGNLVSASETAPNKYWTFSSGVDVILPKGVNAFIAVWEDNQIRIAGLSEEELALDGGYRGIKANNGVLLACENGKGGDAYTFVAVPGTKKSGATVATTDAKSYKGNCLEPAIVNKQYDPDNYMILNGNTFHSIAAVGEVPACKAVFSKAKAQAK